MSGFDKFAGQEVASGIRKNEPIMAFEEEATATKLANIAAVQGLLPKISKIIDELKAANIALVEKVNALEERSKGFDMKISALSGEAAKVNAGKKDDIEIKKKEFDEAYDRAMESLGFRVKKE